MIKDNFSNLIFNKSKLFIYSNYFLAFLASLIFLISAKILNLQNIDKYILIISIATIISSVIYSVGIKSKIIDKKITVGISKKTMISIVCFLIIVSFYLFTKGASLIFFFFIHLFFETSFNLISIYFIKNENTKNHSIFQFLNSFVKILFLIILSFFYQDLFKIFLIYYFLFLLIFLFYFKKLQINFEINYNLFNLYDLIFVLSGSLIFKWIK